MSSGNLTFPDRPSCFPTINFGVVSENGCENVTTTMLDFLNITTAESYFQAYCLNPPDDSCSFGFCPNSDIAGPAVRYSMYVTNICLAIVVLYSPKDAKDSFYSQILTVYSLIIAGIVSVAAEDLTRLHAIFVVIAAASPLTLYLFIHALRAACGNRSRLYVLFGTERPTNDEDHPDDTSSVEKPHQNRSEESPSRLTRLNRVLVLAVIPIWLALFVFLAIPAEHARFQQRSCEINGNHHLIQVVMVTFILGALDSELKNPFYAIIPALILLPFIAWFVSIWALRKKIWDKSSGRFPLLKIWHVVMDRYPFIEFCILIIIPHLYWILSLEIGAFFAHEPFSASYGQLLSIFVAVPPLISTVSIFPRFTKWFGNLTWYRWLLREDGSFERLPSDEK